MVHLRYAILCLSFPSEGFSEGDPDGHGVLGLCRQRLSKLLDLVALCCCRVGELQVPLFQFTDAPLHLQAFAFCVRRSGLSGSEALQRAGKQPQSLQLRSSAGMHVVDLHGEVLVLGCTIPECKFRDT